jgi:hypothetical protein
MSKLAKNSSGADEAVVAQISRRVPMKVGASEGLHMMGSFYVLQLKAI